MSVDAAWERVEALLHLIDGAPAVWPSLDGEIGGADGLEGIMAAVRDYGLEAHDETARISGTGHWEISGPVDGVTGLASCGHCVELAAFRARLAAMGLPAERGE